MIDLSKIKPGQKLKLGHDNHKYWWHVRAVRHPYIICTTSSFGYYTILDLDHNIRSSGTSWGIGHRHQEDVDLSMLALHGEHPDGLTQELSRRNQVGLSVLEIKD